MLLQPFTRISVLQDNSFVPGWAGFTAGTILFSAPPPSVKAATNLSGIWNILFFKASSQVAHIFTVLFGREGELGRILVKEEEELTETRGQSDQTAENLNCNEIGGKESDQKKSNYHISCFRCYVCFKILKASETEREIFQSTAKNIHTII